MSKPGMRIYTGPIPKEQQYLDLFRDAPVATISDCSNRMFAMHAGIRPMGKGKRLLGFALTVKSAMADNLLFHKALSMAGPNDVIVVDACGDENYSVCGDVMFRYAVSKGVAGIVVNGCIRDVDYLQENDFPVYALGVTPRGPYKSPVGEINFDVVCGGQVVHPGDIIVGDSDGIVVVRQEDAVEMKATLDTVIQKEDLMTALIENGTWDTESPLLKLANSELARVGFDMIE